MLFHKIKVNLFTDVLLFVILIIFFVVCLRYPLKPKILPQGILMIVLLLLLIQLILDISKKLLKDTENNIKSEEKYIENQKEFWQISYSFIFLLLWVFLLQYLGFVVSTVLFIFSFALLHKGRNYLKLLAISIVTALILFFAIAKILMVKLPTGFLF